MTQETSNKTQTDVGLVALTVSPLTVPPKKDMPPTTLDLFISLAI